MTAPLDPAASARSPVAPRSAARASVPGGSSSAAAPAAEEDGKTSPQLSRERAAVGMTGPETGASSPFAAPVRARVKTPAGSAPDADDALLAGSRGLRGAEWQAAVKAAQSKRRRSASSAAAKPPPLPPVTGGAALTATATCMGGCGWTAGPGDPAEVDKAANAHTTKPPKHPTSVVAEVAEIGGAA